MHALLLAAVFFAGLAGAVTAQDPLETDVLPTSAGDLTITFVGHASLVFAFNGKVFHIDPYGRLADYTKLPKADAILLTHDHTDHLDAITVQQLRTTNTVILLTAACAERVRGGIVMTNGAVRTVMGVRIEAVPAYNIVHTRGDGMPFHPKGIGNGYILGFGDKRVYVAGDTENTPEMKALTGIDVAFLPMNLPYTMTPEMVADAARAFRPKILYPYHYGETDTSTITRLLKDEPQIEVRIRRMK